MFPLRAPATTRGVNTRGVKIRDVYTHGVNTRGVNTRDVNTHGVNTRDVYTRGVNTRGVDDGRLPAPVVEPAPADMRVQARTICVACVLRESSSPSI